MSKAYYVVATKFHNGGIISKHRTQRAAERAAKRWRMRDCSCGCCGVVSVSELLDLRRGDAASNPYELVL